MTWLLLGLLGVVFIEMCFLLRLPEKIATMARVGRDSLGLLVSSKLDDGQKEIAVRKASLDLLKATLVFSTRFVLTCVVGYLAYRLAVELFPDRRGDMLRLLVSPAGVIAMIAASACYLWVRNAVRQKL